MQEADAVSKDTRYFFTSKPINLCFVFEQPFCTLSKTGVVQKQNRGEWSAL